MSNNHSLPYNAFTYAYSKNNLNKIFANNVFSLNTTVAEAEKENSVKQKQVTLPQIFSAYIELPRCQVANALEELNKRIYEHDKNITLGGVKEEVTLKVICSSMYCNRLPYTAKLSCFLRFFSRLRKFSPQITCC